MNRRSGGPRGRRTPSGKNNTPLMIGGGVGVVVVGVVLFMILGGGDKTSGDGKPTTPKSTETVGGAPMTTDKPSADMPRTADTTQDVTPEVGKPAQPTRVSGRDPRTLKMDDLLDTKDRLYVDATTRTAIESLKLEVDEYWSNRYDVNKAMQAEFKRLNAAVDKGRTNNFLRTADDELNKYNDLLKNDLRRKAKDGQFLPKAFRGFAIEPYAIFVQADIDGAEEKFATEVADQLSQLRADFLREFSKFIDLEEKKNKDQVIKVMLLRTFEDYQKYNRARAPEKDDTLVLAHYEPNSKMLVVPLSYEGRVESEDPAYTLKSVMFHEGTHQLVHAYSNQNHLSAYGPMWCDEGLAEHFGGYTVLPDGKYAFRKLNPMRCEAIARMGKNPDNRLPLEDVLKWSRSVQAEEQEKNRMKTDMTSLQVYAQGWALIDFLNYWDNGKYRPKFEAMMKRLFKEGDTGLMLFRRNFDTDAEFETIRKEFNEYLSNIAKAWNEKRIYDGAIHDAPR